MLSTIVDYFKEIIEGIKERVRNPFTERNTTPFAGAFVIALLLYNWQLVFSIFSFDQYETRLSKIEIIDFYLKKVSWVRRIAFPILIAFGSIIFFYVFNIISLGLTTFFNRWFKGVVLFLTDRSKIITREDFEKVNNRAGISKKNYDRIRSDLLNSEDERATLDKQLSELTHKYEQLVSENESLKNQTATTTTATNEISKKLFRIIYARYGTEDTYNDVTEIVRNLITLNGKFTVDNKALEGDPVIYSIKNLFIIYELNNVTQSLTANEAEIIELKDGKLQAIPTELSQRKQTYLQNQEKIGNIFSGSWTLKFTKDGQQDSEPVIIDNLGRYFAHSKLRFFLKTISIDESSKKIAFNKVDLHRKLHSKEMLTIHDSDSITGTDSKGYKLDYKRQEID